MHQKLANYLITLFQSIREKTRMAMCQSIKSLSQPRQTQDVKSRSENDHVYSLYKRV